MEKNIIVVGYLNSMMNSTMITDAIDDIGKSSWLSILAFIIGLFSVLYALKNKKERLPCYAIASKNIIRDFVSIFKRLEIKYSDQDIKNFTVTKVAFWNKGGKTINKEDVVTADPISIHIKNGNKILDREIIGENEKTNNFSLDESADGARFNINFDYIDKNNGIVIQILHTGKSSEDIEFCGKIKEAGEVKRINVNLKPFFIIGMILTFTFEFLLIYYVPAHVFKSYFPSEILASIIAMILVLMPLILTLFIGNRLNGLPEGLGVFNDNIIDHQRETDKGLIKSIMRWLRE
jgi:hypothetical protein